MEDGQLVRVEELTRIPSEVQDALLTVLSEKALPIPELGIEVQARPGFNLIATANDRDRGVNDLSSALHRRFNSVVLPLPATLDEPASATAGDPPGPAAGAPEESKSAAEADEEVAAEPFVPSEKISADSAVSFPVDI